MGLSALTRIQQRHFDKDQRPDIIINHLNPGYVATDMSSHKGPMNIAQGSYINILCILLIIIHLTIMNSIKTAADAPCWLALLPPNVQGPKGDYVWHTRQIVDWVNGPLPSSY